MNKKSKNRSAASWWRSGPVINHQPKGYSTRETADGYVFSIDASGILYPIHVAKIEPKVSIQMSQAAEFKYRYAVTIHNDKHAKDAIRTVRFSYNRGEVPTAVEFSDALAPEGWERTVAEGTGFFTGELKPGATATFAVTSTLEPERSLLVISGIDHKARAEEREAIVAQGASLHFFRYIANQLGNREYRVFPLRDHGKLEPAAFK